MCTIFFGCVDSSFVPPIIYAIFGDSKYLAVGTVAACSLLIAEIIGEVASPKTEPALYLHLVFTATFVTGIMQTLLGVLRCCPDPERAKIMMQTLR